MRSQKNPEPTTTQVSRELQRTCMKKRMTRSAFVPAIAEHDDVVQRAEVDFAAATVETGADDQRDEHQVIHALRGDVTMT